MNMNHVEQFMTIVKYMNLSKASKELYISQPALSMSLSRLETELGVRLFYRDGNKLVLSNEGKELYDYFKDLEESHDRLMEKARSLKFTPETPIKIGFSGSAFQFSSMYVSNYLNENSRQQVQKIFADRDLLTSLLLSRQIDFAITYPPLRNEELSSMNLMSEELNLVVSDHHPLAEFESVTLQELQNTPLIGLRRGHLLRDTIDELFIERGCYLTYQREFDYEDFFRYISEHAGKDDTAAICVANCFDTLYGDGYRIVPIKDNRFYRITAVAWLTSQNSNYKYKDLLDNIVNNYSKQAAYHMEMIHLYASQAAGID